MLPRLPPHAPKILNSFIATLCLRKIFTLFSIIPRWYSTSKTVMTFMGDLASIHVRGRVFRASLRGGSYPLASFVKQALLGKCAWPLQPFTFLPGPWILQGLGMVCWMAPVPTVCCSVRVSQGFNSSCPSVMTPSCRMEPTFLYRYFLNRLPVWKHAWVPSCFAWHWLLMFIFMALVYLSCLFWVSQDLRLGTTSSVLRIYCSIVQESLNQLVW